MKFIPAQEYADKVNLPVSLIKELCRSRTLPGIKHRTWHVDVDSADEALKEVMNKRAQKKQYAGANHLPSARSAQDFQAQLKAARQQACAKRAAL